MKPWMIAAIVFVGTGATRAQLAGPAPPDREPLRNGFLTASETVLDDLHAVDLGDPAAAVDAQVATVKTAQANVEAMAENDREHTVAERLNAAVFAIQACRIVATDGQDSKDCREREARAEAYALETMGVHREGAAWAPNTAR